MNLYINIPDPLSWRCWNDMVCSMFLLKYLNPDFQFFSSANPQRLYSTFKLIQHFQDVKNTLKLKLTKWITFLSQLRSTEAEMLTRVIYIHKHSWAETCFTYMLTRLLKFLWVPKVHGLVFCEYRKGFLLHSLVKEFKFTVPIFI